MVSISRQKIYNSLLQIQAKFHTFDDLVLFVTYQPYQGLRLNVRMAMYARKASWVKNSIEVTDCLKKKDLVECAEAIATEIEIWTKHKGF